MTSVARGLLDASRPERQRLQAFLVRSVLDLGRATALGAAALGASTTLPSVATGVSGVTARREGRE